MADPVQATSWWKDLWDVLQPTFISIIVALGAYIVVVLRAAASKRALQAAQLDAMIKAMKTTATKVEEVHAATVSQSATTDDKIDSLAETADAIKASVDANP